MSRHRASSFINIYGLNYCADHTNGNIYEYSLDIYSDNGDPIIKQRDTAVIHGGLFGAPGKKLFIDEVEFIIVSGYTDVSGTGLGPQPIAPEVVLTNCNEVWTFGNLTPDLHVAGVAAGVWDKDIIIGTGTIKDLRVESILTPTEGGAYAEQSGYSLGVTSGIAETFYPDCQWYDYAGPELSNKFAGPTYDFTDSSWVKTGTGTAVTNTTGPSGDANESSVLTDTSNSVTYYAYKRTANLTFVRNGLKAVVRSLIYKDVAATQWSAIYINTTGNPYVTIECTFNQATGVINTTYTDTDAVGLDLGVITDVRDCGDWWEVLIQFTRPSTGIPSEAQVAYFPAYNTDGSGTVAVATMGSIRVADTGFYGFTSDSFTIGKIRSGAFEPKGGGAAPSSVIDQSTVNIDLANHSNTEGGYYIEWRPQYSASEITGDVLILTLNDSAGLLYYDYSDAALKSTDGTNTVSVPLTLVGDTKYRCAVAFGSSKLRVAVDSVWGTEGVYDGAFPTGSIFEICANSEGVNYWRELRGFQVSYNDAIAELSTLMQGGSGGGYPPPPAADPQDEILTPYWTVDGIVTGNYIDLADFTSESFASMFGVTIEGADFNTVFSVTGDGATQMRGLVNTSDSGNRLQIQDTIDCNYASLYVCDASGNVVDSMTYTGIPNGDSVLVPTGANYYIIVASDTGNCKVKKWDSSVVSVSGATSWTSFFGVALSTSRVLYDEETTIPAAGISIWFTAPSTAAAYKLSFSTIETTSTPGTTRTGSVNQTVGDYTSSPTHTWGIGGSIVCDLNSSGGDMDIIPGETYIFSVRNDSPTSNNWIRVQATLVAQ